MPEPEKWTILRSEFVVDSPWYRLRKDACKLPDGSVIDPYYVREHRGFAVIFAITPSADVVLTSQYKHGIGEPVFELPAGALEDSETPAQCAERELREETGYAADAFEPIARYIADPTSSTGRVHLYLARDVRREFEPMPDPSEAIETTLLPLDAVLEAVRTGRINVAGHVAAVYAVLDRLGKLRGP